MHAKILGDMFLLGVPVLEKILRPLIVYLFLVIALRLAGKVLLTLSNTVQNAIIGEDNSVSGGLIGATTLLVVNYFVVRLLYGHEKLERLVEGEEDVIIEGGKVRTERLKKELITLTELTAAAHRQGFASLEEVERAVLEPGGTIAFFGKRPAPEETRHQELLRRLEELERRVESAPKGEKPWKSESPKS